MKKASVFFVMAFLSYGQLLAQYNSARSRVWVMGNRSGLDFNASPPNVFTSNIQNSVEGCAAVCDTLGQLLFYTNGTDVWTASGTIMPYGTHFNGSSSTTYSTTQGALIVPDPGNVQRYYLFSLTSLDNSKLFCSVVDMSLNAGAGAVDTGFVLHQSMISDGLTEKMTAVAGCQENVWLIVHLQQQAVFRIYELSALGLNLNYTESGWGTMPATAYSGGVIKANPAGDRLVACNTYNHGTGIEIYDFDKASGTLSNAFMLDSGAYYGACFSPSGNMLYGQKVASQEIYQFDLMSGDPAASKQLIGLCRPYSDMKIGPDSMVYFISRRGTTHKYLGRIEQPDVYGAGCGFRDSITALAFENTAYANLMYGLPNDVAIAIPAARTVHTLVLDTFICPWPESGFLMEAAPGNEVYQWNDGSTGSQKTVYESGTYWVRYKLEECGLGTDTFRVTMGAMPPPQIIVNENQLSVSASYAAFQWFKDGTPILGAQQASLIVQESGWYSIVVQDQFGCEDTTGVLMEGITRLDEYTTKRPVSLYPNPTKESIMLLEAVGISGVLRTVDGRFLKSHDFSRGPLSLKELASGIYLLYLYNESYELMEVSKVLRMD